MWWLVPRQKTINVTTDVHRHRYLCAVRVFAGKSSTCHRLGWYSDDWRPWPYSRAREFHCLYAFTALAFVIAGCGDSGFFFVQYS